MRTENRKPDVSENENGTITAGEILSTREAATYLGMEYAYFRKWRNIGYFGRDKYPAPPFLCYGENETMIRYHRVELDSWLAGYPRYQTPATYFATTSEKTKKRSAAISYER